MYVFVFLLDTNASASDLAIDYSGAPVTDIELALMAFYDDLLYIGPKTTGFAFFIVFSLIYCVLRRVIRSCQYSQQKKLRDEYETELRRGGKITNRLLLPEINGPRLV